MLLTGEEVMKGGWVGLPEPEIEARLQGALDGLADRVRRGVGV